MRFSYKGKKEKVFAPTIYAYLSSRGQCAHWNRNVRIFRYCTSLRCEDKRFVWHVTCNSIQCDICIPLRCKINARAFKKSTEPKILERYRIPHVSFVEDRSSFPRVFLKTSLLRRSVFQSTLGKDFPIFHSEPWRILYMWRCGHPSYFEYSTKTTAHSAARFSPSLSCASFPSTSSNLDNPRYCAG